MRPELFSTDDILLLDGAMGTVLQQRGLPPGGRPELLNLTDGDLIAGIHRDYVAAGSRVIYANTFGANALKLEGTGHTVEEIVSAAVALARSAVGDSGARVALDMGPIGELLEPMGTLTFERAYEVFRGLAVAGEQAGADLAVIETMTDLYEVKAALLAVKENTDRPVLACMSYDEGGRTFTGCTIPSMACTLEGLGADAIGLNCSLGPAQMAPLVAELCRRTRLPVAIKPNAGLPDPVDGHYDVGPQDFAAALLPCLEAGATLFGGCCGTSPEYIQVLARTLAGKRPGKRGFVPVSMVCTPVTPLVLDGVHVIGERINPTGKKRFQQALLEGDLDFILDTGVRQADAGAELLDVNVGHPGVDEPAMMVQVVKKLQGALSLRLQLDSSSPAALEAGLRVYNGKAVVNSVNGDPAVLERILPIVKKYGAAVVGLTLDEKGLPQTARERLDIARRILRAALDHGIPREDVWIDCLTLTVSAQQDQAAQTLEAVRLVREELGLHTVLGVSNVSFGLPRRELITQSFLTQALAAGLTLPILNPNQTEMMDAVAAFRVLSGEDRESRDYIARFAGAPAPTSAPAGADTGLTLEEAVARGLQGDAGRLAREALETEDELHLIAHRLIPALDKVGEDYEKGIAFLPQLMSAAGAAQAVFEAVRASLAQKGGPAQAKGKIVVATVKGDIHDIGKNIVKTILENYGYQLVDLGRDVPPQAVARAVEEGQVTLVGLSALMTTTLAAMEETIGVLKALPHPPTVFVGGAVLTPEYAAHMGADYYAKDARQAVDIARRVLG